MKIRAIVTVSALVLLSACAHQPVDTAFAHIDSGITAQNGGGQNSTDGLINGDLKTTPVGPSGPVRKSGSPTDGLGGPSADPPYLAGRHLPDSPEVR